VRVALAGALIAVLLLAREYVRAWRAVYAPTARAPAATSPIVPDSEGARR
jgi:hypothetical protein